ncbi:MAG TPA: hypothetical protein VND91_03705, partial [Candidatus Saccharimonadia bacterium]|nr:hypothetical protein [Candidatus Saccharimonadia bacterium]
MSSWGRCADTDLLLRSRCDAERAPAVFPASNRTGSVSMRRHASTTSIVGFVLACVVASPQASDLEWRTLLETGGATRPFLHPSAQATEDGGFQVSGRTSGGEWLARFDAEGRLLQRRRIARFGAAGANVVGAESLAGFTRSNVPVPIEWQCQVERTAAGLVRMHLGVEFAGPYGHASVDRLLHTSSTLTPPLFWLGRDCRVSAMPDVGAERILQLHHDPVREGVFAVLGNAALTASELVHVDRRAVHWRRANPAVAPRSRPRG